MFNLVLYRRAANPHTKIQILFCVFCLFPPNFFDIFKNMYTQTFQSSVRCCLDDHFEMFDHFTEIHIWNWPNIGFRQNSSNKINLINTKPDATCFRTLHLIQISTESECRQPPCLLFFEFPLSVLWIEEKNYTYRSELELFIVQMYV